MKKVLSFLCLFLFVSAIYAQEKDESILNNFVNVLTEQYGLEGVTGSFDLAVPAATQCRGVYVGSDVNQNAVPEIILTSYSDGGKVHVFEVTGDNSTTEIWTSPNIGSSSGTSVRSVQVGDLDGNGDFEIIVSVNGTGGADDAVGGLMIYEYSTATSSWDTGYHTVIDSGALTNRWNIEGIDVFDVDGDGKQEVLISNNGTGSFDSCYVISFNGTFDGGATMVKEFGWGKNGSPSIGGSAINATHGDLDGNGQMEAIFGIWDNCSVLIAEATAPDTYVFRKYIQLDLRGGDAVPLKNLAVADLDNNGRDEVYSTLYSGTSAGALVGLRVTSVFDSMTQANSVYEIAGPGESGAYGIAVGDVDGNGNKSLYTAAYSNGKIIGHEFSGGDVTDPNNYTASTLGQHATAVGSFALAMSPTDLDGDSYKELIVSYIEGDTVGGSAYEYTTTVSTFPYMVDFEDGGSIPTNWENDAGDSGQDWEFDIPGGGSNPVQYGATQDHTTGTGYVAWLDDSSPSTNPTNLLTPPLDLTGLTSPRVTFWYWIGTGSTDNSELHIDIFNGSTWTDSVVVVTNNDEWDNVAVDLTPYKSSATKVRFRAMESTDFRSDITLDDVEISETPVNPVISVNTDSINFGINNVADTSAFTTVTVTNMGGGSLNVTSIGLLDATDYVLVDTNSYPAALGTFESISVDVAFSPITVGTKATELDINYATLEDVFPVYLTGTAINPNFGGGGTDPLSGGYFFANSTPSASGAPSQPQFNWIDITTTGTNILGDLTDDNIGGPYPIGFTFNYFGTDYTQFWLSSNGWLSFDDNAASSGSQQRTNTTVPNTDLPNNMIMLLWDDLNPADTDVLNRACLFGNDTNGDLVVSLINYPEFAADVDGWITAQFILKQNGNIKLQYLDHGASIDLSSSTIGIENSDGTLGVQYHFNGTGGPIFGSPLALEFGQDSTTVPVELTSFAASTSERDIILNWSTATETNSDKYIVQRSKKDLGIWESIGEVRSAGNTTESQSYSFVDSRLNSGTFNYRLKMVDLDGTYEYSSEIEATVGLPTTYSLSQNYPNPFNPSTRIEYALPVDSRVRLELYSITGEKVAELLNSEQSAGYYTLDFNSSNISSGLASGIYIYRIAASGGTNGKNFVSVKKMMLLK